MRGHHRCNHAADITPDISCGRGIIRRRRVNKIVALIADDRGFIKVLMDNPMGDILHIPEFGLDPRTSKTFDGLRRFGLTAALEGSSAGTPSATKR